MREFAISLDPLKANWVIQSDGGRRSETCAAAAVVVGMWARNNGQLHYEPWFAQGTLFTTAVSVFQTEAIALDQGTEWCKQRLEALNRVAS